jgi:hypothetical protein
MIIAQYNPANIATQLANNTTALTPFAVSANGVASGIRAGNVSLAVGKGFNLGVPFHVVMQGVATIKATSATFTPGFTAFTNDQPNATSGSTIPLTTACNAAASTSLTQSAGGNLYPFYVDYELVIDGSSNKLAGISSGAVGIASGSLALTLAGPVTGNTGTVSTFSLPSPSAPYSWPSPITGLDTAITNAPFLFLQPQFTMGTNTATSSVQLFSFYVSQG